MSLTEKLYKAQQEMPDLQKNAINPHFKNTYITLDAVLDAVLPVLHKNGVLLLQMPTHINGAPGLETRFADAETGEILSNTMPLQTSKPGPQEQGSALTYARRYALLATLGLVADEDDDAEAASPKSRVVQQPNTATQKQSLGRQF